MGVEKLDARAIAAIEEALSNYSTAREILKKQSIPTTPANVAAAIEEWLKPLSCWVSAENELDAETANQLIPQARALRSSVERRLSELRAHPKIQSSFAELAHFNMPYLRVIWERLAAPEFCTDRGARRRQFVIRVLDIGGIPHPDPAKHQAELDHWIDSDIHKNPPFATTL